MVGENEMKEGRITLKNMQSGEQTSVTPMRWRQLWKADHKIKGIYCL